MIELILFVAVAWFIGPWWAVGLYASLVILSGLSES